MGPDLNTMLKQGFKSLYELSMLALWSMEIKDSRFKERVKLKEKDHSHWQQIKLNKFTVSLWVKRRENLNPISMCIVCCLCLVQHCEFVESWH